MRNYSFLSIVQLFYTYSLVGWIWEVSYHLVKDHLFFNRGFPYGPWLPIYGFGGVFIICVLVFGPNGGEGVGQKLEAVVRLSGFL